MKPVNSMSVYFDYQSAKPVDPRVMEAMLPFLHERFGNPSSLHLVGDDATRILDESRQAIAGFINADAEEIIFTSGATESNNLALVGFALGNRDRGNHIILSEIEHISIHNTAKYLEKQGFEVTRVPVDQYGRVRSEKIEERLTERTILVSLTAASNEVGTIQPITEVGRLCRERHIAFHSDAVAAEGLLPLNVKKDNIDLLTLSSNDIYGPRGLGILFKKKGLRLNPMLLGGGQENGFRSGSENITAIAGLKKAVEIMQQEMNPEVIRLTSYRDALITGISKAIPHSDLNGHPEERLPNNVHFRFEGIEGESLLLSLKDRGISVSTGSACSSKTLEPSHTLISMGLLHEEAHGSLELTCGRFNTARDVSMVLEILPEAVSKIRSLSPLYRKEKLT